MKKFFTLLLVSFLASTLAMEARVNHLLPIPKAVVERDVKAFYLSRDVSLSDPTDCELLKDFLTDNGCQIMPSRR